MVGVTSRDEVLAVLARWEAAHAELAALDVTALSPPDVLAIARRLETGYRAQPALGHRLIHQLISHTTPTELGAPTWPKVLAEALGISVSDAKGRLTHAQLLGPRTTLGGQPLAPLLAHTAAAQAAGRIGAEHLATITGFFHDLPPHIDATTRAQAEADLARIATTLGPTQFRTAAHRLALLLNQDGELPDDAHRARRRYLSIDRQGVDGMSGTVRLTVDPTLALLVAGRGDPAFEGDRERVERWLPPHCPSCLTAAGGV
jgi:hypothetical protein